MVSANGFSAQILSFSEQIGYVMFTKSRGLYRAAVCFTVVALMSATLGGSEPGNAPSGSTASSASETPDVIQGFTEPYADIDMAASETGTVSSVLVREGDVVAAGQLLAGLDDVVLRASLRVAKAGMEAKGELQSAETQLEIKRSEFQKLTELFSRNHASQQELDRVSGELRVAEARVQSVLEDLEIRRLEYARIEAQISRRAVRSTIDGIVVEVKKDEGEFVSPSDAVVARVVQLDPLLVVFSVPAEKRSDISAGQQVLMEIGTAQHRVSGEVEFVSPTVDASSGSARVKVRLPNPNGRWSSGEKAVLVTDESDSGTKPARVAKNTESE